MDDTQEVLFGASDPPDPEKKIRWYLLEGGNRISSSDLGEAERGDQLEAMRRWFYANYQDPVENCPHDSGEGGYQYIYGGPFDAHEELNAKFGGVVDDEIIEELANDLDDISAEWSGNPDGFDADFDDYLFRSSADSLCQEEAFEQSALNIERLMEAKVEAADRQCMLRLLYVNVITALETYLSDKFISSVNADERLLRKFVETTPEFKNQRVPLSDVFSTHETMKKRVQEHLVDVVWHRLDKVGPMFHDTLDISFPPDMKELHKALIVRHDCVHRNGKTKDGEELILSETGIQELLSRTRRLVKWIEADGKEEDLDSMF